MTYIMSDPHGRFKEFKSMLKKINFSENDTLYIIGDVLDRGESPIKLLQFVMETENIHLLLGNHELYAILALPFFTVNIKEENYDFFVTKEHETLLRMWSANGSHTTINEFKKLSLKNKFAVIEYLKNLNYSKELTINGKNFLLAHSYCPALKYPPNLSYEDNLKQIIRIDYEKSYFEDKIFISGHTPTFFEQKAEPGKIFIYKQNINVDCGMNSLGCLRLDDFEEFYL